MRRTANGALGCIALGVSACISSAEQNTPALIVNATPESHAELTQVVSSALGVANVTLANDALTRNSGLIIDRKPARDASGQRLSGREYGRPEHFELVKQGTECVLIHVEAGQRYSLQNVSCAATE